MNSMLEILESRRACLNLSDSLIRHFRWRKETRCPLINLGLIWVTLTCIKRGDVCLKNRSIVILSKE